MSGKENISKSLLRTGVLKRANDSAKSIGLAAVSRSVCSTGRRSTYVAYFTEQACEKVTSDLGPSGGLRQMCHDLCALRGDVLLMLLILLSRHARKLPVT